MLRKLVTTAAVLALFAAFTTLGLMALFTDTAAVPSNTFSTGTIDIGTTPASAVVTLSNMAPGDSNPTGVPGASLLVTNTSTLASRYAISSVATNADAKALKDQLVLTIRGIDVTVPATPCDIFDGAVLYTGDMDSTAGKLVGDSATGFQAGDRALAASTGEQLCFKVTLPLAAGNAFQNATTTATFTFDAEQTVNN